MLFSKIGIFSVVKNKKKIGPSSGATIGETGKGKLLLVGRRRKKSLKRRLTRRSGTFVCYTMARLYQRYVRNKETSYCDCGGLTSKHRPLSIPLSFYLSNNQLQELFWIITTCVYGCVYYIRVRVCVCVFCV